LTAYLRPSPSQDPEYFAERDRRISEYVRAFSRDFASWRNLKYKDEDRARSLSAIFRSAAELGIWVFSQPTDLQFRWPEKSEMGPDRVAVTPALIKMTDEMGQALRKPQVILEAMTKSIR